MQARYKVGNERLRATAKHKKWECVVNGDKENYLGAIYRWEEGLPILTMYFDYVFWCSCTIIKAKTGDCASEGN